MPDREKVIAELQEYHDREWTDERMDGYREREIRKRATGNALALLKEQEEKLKFLDALYNYINPNDMEKYMQMYKSLPISSDGRSVK